MALATHLQQAVPLFRLLHGIVDSVALPVTGLELDSRKLKAGDLFLALRGEQHDGRNYLAQAEAAGAVAIVAEAGVTPVQREDCSLPIVEVDGLGAHVGEIAARFYGFPSRDMTVIGVTGTNGKTTTSRVLAQLLRAHLGSCGVIGTLGATLEETVEDATNTTPDALSLQRQLADWRDEGVAGAALEVSSHSLDQGRVNGMAFNTAIYTNLTHDHLDYHGDMDSYAAAKARLFASEGLEHAVINRDDPYADVMISALAPETHLWLYGLEHSEVAVGASGIHYHDAGLEARIHTPWGDGLLHSPLAGDFNLANLLAAISAACLAGMSLDAALDAVSTLKGVEGRMQYVPNNRDLQLVVDYAHTPDALAKALEALRAHTDGRLHCVFGCGGDRDRDKRPVMGQMADRYADRLVVTSDNPRHEEPMAIIEDILPGIAGEFDVEPDRAAAIALAVAGAAPGDCVLVAGKGHESYQQVGDERRDFSDVVALQRALEVEA